MAKPTVYCRFGGSALNPVNAAGFMGQASGAPVGGWFRGCIVGFRVKGCSKPRVLSIGGPVL